VPSRPVCSHEAIAAVREQGGLVGIPHPFDSHRGSLLRDAAMDHARGRWSTGSRRTTLGLIGNGNETDPGFAMGQRPARDIGLGRPLGASRIGVAYTASVAIRRHRPDCSPRLHSIEIIPAGGELLDQGLDARGEVVNIGAWNRAGQPATVSSNYWAAPR
jgi:hypothetical protein